MLGILGRRSNNSDLRMHVDVEIGFVDDPARKKDESERRVSRVESSLEGKREGSHSAPITVSETRRGGSQIRPTRITVGGGNEDSLSSTTSSSVTTPTPPLGSPGCLETSSM